VRLAWFSHANAHGLLQSSLSSSGDLGTPASKSERGEMAENAEGAGFCLHPSFLGSLVENASRYKVEKLLEDDNVREGWFLVHTPY